MKLSTNVVAIVVPIILLGGIGVSAAFNMWQTESSKTPAVYTEGELAGQFNPADIRGSYSLGDIEKNFDIPVDVLARAFGAVEVEDPAAFKVKELEEIYGDLADQGVEVGTDSVRLFVALYKNLPYQPEETTALPNPAASQLRQLGSLTPEQLAFVEERKVDVSSFTTESTTETHAETVEDRTIKGMTTFGELLSWGVTAQQIEEVIGVKIGARGTAMRDFFTEQGTEFSAYKERLQALVDGVQK